MKTKKTVFRLEHPSKGKRKESILTDEMLVAFCESRIDWLDEDIRDAFKEMEAFHQKIKSRMLMALSGTPEIIASPYEIVGFQLPYAYRKVGYTSDMDIVYLEPTFYLNIQNKEKSHWGRSEFEIRIPLGADQWKEGEHYLDPNNARISYRADCNVSQMREWMKIYDWLFDSPEFFDYYVGFCEAEQQEYFEYVEKQSERIKRRHEEINQLRWKKALASKRALQSRALDIIEFGYEGEEQKLFKKVDRPMMVKSLEITKVTPSKKSVDVKVVGRDFVKYTYDSYGIWRTGTVYGEEKEWVQKNVRIQTLFEMNIVEDYSEEKCPYDPTIQYLR